jgi:NAD(P)-dependent dehydrogenase (short-subunit alcohol dehydrogenase family)
VGRRGDLDGTVLFIAGVGPQMGAATARVAAREGAKVALAARGSEVPAQVAAEIRAQGGRALGLKCDLTDAASLAAAVRATKDELGPIDCVFYNAGFYDNDHSSIEIDPDLWKLTMDVNFNGALLLAQAHPAFDARASLRGFCIRGTV